MIYSSDKFQANSNSDEKKCKILTNLIIQGYELSDNVLEVSREKAQEKTELWVDNTNNILKRIFGNSERSINFLKSIRNERRDYLTDKREIMKKRIKRGIASLKAIRNQINLNSDKILTEDSSFLRIKNDFQTLLPLLRREKFDEFIDEIISSDLIGNEFASKTLHHISIRLREGPYCEEDRKNRTDASRLLLELARRINNPDIALECYNEAIKYSETDKLNNNYEIVSNCRITVLFLSEIWIEQIEVQPNIEKCLNESIGLGYWEGKKTISQMTDEINYVKTKIMQSKDHTVSDTIPDSTGTTTLDVWNIKSKTIYKILEKIELNKTYFTLIKESFFAFVEVLSRHLNHPDSLRNYYDSLSVKDDSRSTKKEERIFHPWLKGVLDAKYFHHITYEETKYEKKPDFVYKDNLPIDVKFGEKISWEKYLSQFETYTKECRAIIVPYFTLTKVPTSYTIHDSITIEERSRRIIIIINFPLYFEK